MLITPEIKDTGWVSEEPVAYEQLHKGTGSWVRGLGSPISPGTLLLTHTLLDLLFYPDLMAARSRRGPPGPPTAREVPRAGDSPVQTPPTITPPPASPGHSGRGHRVVEQPLLRGDPAPGQRARLHRGGSGHGEPFPQGSPPNPRHPRRGAGSQAHPPKPLGPLVPPLPPGPPLPGGFQGWALPPWSRASPSRHGLPALPRARP